MKTLAFINNDNEEKKYLLRSQWIVSLFGCWLIKWRAYKTKEMSDRGEESIHCQGDCMQSLILTGQTWQRLTPEKSKNGILEWKKQCFFFCQRNLLKKWNFKQTKHCYVLKESGKVKIFLKKRNMNNHYSRKRILIALGHQKNLVFSDGQRKRKNNLTLF